MIIKGNERKRSRDYYHSVTGASYLALSFCFHLPRFVPFHPSPNLPLRFSSLDIYIYIYMYIYRNFCFAFVLIFAEKEFSIFTSLLPRDPPLPLSSFNSSLPSPHLILDADPFIERQKLILATLDVHSCVSRFN